MSRQREGRKDLMRPEDRERLRRIQSRPKPRSWKLKMGAHWRRRFRLLGGPRRWTARELRLIGTRPDREVARALGRSLSALKAKKFQVLKTKRERREGRCRSRQGRDLHPTPLADNTLRGQAGNHEAASG